MSSNHSDHTYVTANGTRLQLRPVNSFLLEAVSIGLEQQARARGEPLDPPTYKVETVGGDTEEFSHIVNVKLGVDTIEGTADPIERDAARVAWAAHTAARAKLQGAVGFGMMNLLFAKGIVPPSEYVAGDWAEQLARLNVAVPSTEPERLIFWVKAVALSGPAESVGLISTLTQLAVNGLVDEEKVQQALRSFQARAQGNAAGTDKAAKRRVAARTAAGGVPSGASLAPDA